MLIFNRIATVLLIMVLPPAALAQKSSGYMDLDDYSSILGVRLAVFRVMFSKTEAVCPRQTGLFRIRPDGALTDITAIMAGPGPGFAVAAMAGPDDFTIRRRMEADTCRIDLDIGQQQRVNGEWVPLVSALVNESTRSHETAPIVRSPAERAEMDRDEQASAHAGNLSQGLSSTFKTNVGFEGPKDCFEAIWIFQVEQNGVTFLFPAGLKAEINRFFIERVDVDADHSTLYLSRGSCRVGFTISASVSRDGSWVPLPIAPPRQTKMK